MTWTYSGDPADSERDAVRFEIGDIDTTDQLITDEGIDYVLTLEGSIAGAAAACCDKIAAKYARDVDKKIEGTSVSASQRFKHFKELAKELRTRASQSGTPYCGSMYSADQEADEADTSLKQPTFKIGFMDNEISGDED